MNVVDRYVAVFVGAFFAFAGLDKLFHLQGFFNAINNYAFLTIPIGSLLGPLIIGAELMIPIGLLIAPWRRTAALQASLLMVVFTVALIANERLGGRGICGCWFSINMAAGNAHLGLNVLVFLLSFLLWRSLSSPANVLVSKAAGTRPGAR